MTSPGGAWARLVHPVIAFANRLPVVRGRRGWQPRWRLVAALRPALEGRDGAWVGWEGGSGAPPARVEGLDIDLFPVALTQTQVEAYYHGFSNRTLWPLFHHLVQPPVFERR